ncbi:MAG: hypothetical protein ACJ0BS_06175 [Paracoccaceae bacterium]
MVLKEADNKNPPAEVINELIRLYQDGYLSKVSDQIERLLDDYQGSFVLYNLKAWEKFESNNSDAFHGMYQFWCQNNKE